MDIHSSEFVTSSADWRNCPETNKPEFAFIGRSNVGKSSLINMLAHRKDLAKTSSTPGKTQTINHFVMNGKWYVVDLPGYGYASVSKASRYEWGKMIEHYLLQRKNLYCTFVLIDSRIPPQPIDFDFITWMGEKQLPLAIVLTKTDKLKQAQLNKSVETFTHKLLESWSELPPVFITSSVKKWGQEEILHFIADSMATQ
ncbi:MAG: GTP-binding protein EngB [Cytophagales bacterium]|jgi:GTP-binding protein|nr:YihA family ribosome biogenesis GTP-binding protein [Bacteroidota bacterium]MBS1980191.1 YihA family ribosome biogenesis GTP-binding protein [Bacteroidota bacterium]WHZ08707.1 MAG: GTP-binding protein EngB [Cytophagales bacterium]